MAGLTQDEIKILEKYNKEKEAHKQKQREYRQRKKEQNPEQYKETLNKYMKEYNTKKRDEIKEIKKKIIEKPLEQIKPLETIEEHIKPLEPIKEDIKNDDDIINQSLKKSTKDEYLKKSAVIHRLFKKKDLSAELKEELKKLFNNDDNINEALILTEMDYLKNADDILKRLTEYYKSPNSLKSYLNIIVVISSHLKPLFNVYQQLTTTNKDINNKVQAERNKNIIKKGDEEKIISLDKSKILNDINTKLNDPLEILIYGLYTLQPSRRLEYRNMKIINTETDIKDHDTNYLILSSPERFIFYDYKTSKTYGRQEIKILDPLLITIIKHYIKVKNIQNGEYLISQANKNKIISVSNFSTKITNIFYKVLNINTSLDHIRKSHIIYFLDGAKRSNEEKKIFAGYMAHSPQEQSKYYKIL